MPLGALIGAAGSLLGGLLGRSNANDARQASLDMAARNEALQREFAQSGIQWRVADAKKAGIHPIYALGGAGATYTPTATAFTSDTSLPNALAAAGQDIGRAVHKTQTNAGRMDALGRTAQQLQLEGLSLDNDLKRTEIASKIGRLRGDQVGPAMPAAVDRNLIPGQGNSGLIKAKPLEVAPGHPGAPHMEGGPITDAGFSRTKTGFVPLPSKDVKERIEDNLPQEIMHAIRNNLLPNFGMISPPPFKAPEGKEWVWSHSEQEYQLQPENPMYRYWRRKDPLPVRPSYKPRRY